MSWPTTFGSKSGNEGFGQRARVGLSVPVGIFPTVAGLLLLSLGSQPAYAQTQVWSGQMTVGANDKLTYDYLGYMKFDDG